MINICLVIITVLVKLVTSQQVNIDHGVIGIAKNALWNATYTDLLKRDLLAHYDKFSRPTHHSNVTIVTLQLDFKHIELDDTKFIMTVNGWIRMGWQDEKLKWNESEYGGLDSLRVADHEIWQPDIVVFHNNVGSSIDQYGNILSIVWSGGEVLWIPPCQFQVFCEMDLTKWPYDKHSCELHIASWTYAGDAVNLTFKETMTFQEKQELAFDWKVISTSAKHVTTLYECCEEPYNKVVYSVILERVNSAYTMIVFAPAIGVILLSLCVFWFPSNSCNKFVLGGMSAIIEVVFLIYLLQRLPMFGKKTPLIVVFYAYSIILNGLSMMECLLTFKMTTTNYFKSVPWMVTKIINSKVFAILLFPKHQLIGSMNQKNRKRIQRSKLDEDHENLTYIGNNAKRSIPTDWTVVAAALDRVMFYLSLIFYICFIIKCLL